jgi:hypothetical protein
MTLLPATQGTIVRILSDLYFSVGLLRIGIELTSYRVS